MPLGHPGVFTKGPMGRALFWELGQWPCLLVPAFREVVVAGGRSEACKEPHCSLWAAALSSRGGAGAGWARVDFLRTVRDWGQRVEKEPGEESWRKDSLCRGVGGRAEGEQGAGRSG